MTLFIGIAIGILILPTLLLAVWIYILNKKLSDVKRQQLKDVSERLQQVNHILNLKPTDPEYQKYVDMAEAIRTPDDIIYHNVYSQEQLESELHELLDTNE